MTKTDVLKAFPHTPVIYRLRIFYFLWDDPLFNPGEAETLLDLGKTDPEFLIELRRKAKLEDLDFLFHAIANRDARIEELREALAKERKLSLERLARGTWIWKQVVAHISVDHAERVLIDMEVNRIDPDFSYSKAIGAAAADS